MTTIPDTSGSGDPFSTSGFFNGFAVSPQRITNLNAAIDTATALVASVQSSTAAATTAAGNAATAALQAQSAASSAVSSVNSAATTATGNITATANTAVTTINTAAGGAATSASNAATSATNAANSAAAAATSATNAGNASTAATAAAGQSFTTATNAANSATAAGASATAAAISATAAQSAAASATGVGFRNVVTNGSFRFWQRGVTFTGASSLGFTADRWTTSWGGSTSSTTISQAAVTDAAVLADNCEYALRYNVTTAGTGQAFRQLFHKIENPRTLAGQQVTLSFWAKAAAAMSVNAFLSITPGTGGSPAGGYNTSAVAANVTTAWQKFTLTTTLNAASTITPGTAGDGYVNLVFNLPLNALFDLQLTGVSLVAGSVALPFEPRPYSVELAMCQRYYQTGYAWFATVASAASQTIGYGVSFVNPMRGIPSVSVANAGSQTNLATGPSTSVTSPTNVIIYATSAAAGTAILNASFTATSEL